MRSQAVVTEAPRHTLTRAPRPPHTRPIVCACCGIAAVRDGCPRCLPGWCAECGACQLHCECEVFERAKT